MEKDLKIDGEKLYIPKELLKELETRLRSASKPNSKGRSSLDNVKKYVDECFGKLKHTHIYNKAVRMNIGRSEPIIRKALHGKRGSQRVDQNLKVRFDLLNLLCFIAFKVSLTSKIMDANINWHYGLDEPYLYFVILSKDDKKEIDDIFSNQNISLLAIDTERNIQENNQTLNSFNKKSEKNNSDESDCFSNLKIINQSFFDTQKITDRTTLLKYKIDYYLKFNNNPISLARVIANEIYVPPQSNFTFKNENELKELHIEILVESSDIFKPILVKILAIGGSGKSTLLWHFIKLFAEKYTCLYFKRVDMSELRQYLKNIQNPDGKILIFIDEVVTHSENTDELLEFGECISEFSSSLKIILFLSERYYRYQSFKNKNEFEKFFLESEIYLLTYSNSLIRKKVFDKVYECLDLNNFNQTTDLEIYCSQLFNEYSFDSLIDRIINVLVVIKKQYPNLKYKFDWEDWQSSCAGKYEKISNLYKLVAFFYQFGVSVPLQFAKEFYKSPEVAGLIEDLTPFAGEGNIPINRSLEKDHKIYLTLRHEKMGEWYFKIVDGGSGSAEEFFTTFLDEINTRSSSYLFRNLTRNNFEFNHSTYRQLVTNKKILEVIDNYLGSLSEDKYQDDEFKMLMDKHFILLNMGFNTQSIEPLEIILKLDEDNIFAISRLASCLIEQQPQVATILYKSILEKPKHVNNTYAIIGLIEIYYESNDDNFLYYQGLIFKIAESDFLFSQKFLLLCENVFRRLPDTTISLLKKLNLKFPLLSNSIAELLMDKGLLNESYNILENISKNLPAFAFPYRCKTADLFFKLNYLQNTISDNCLVSMKNIISFNELDKKEITNAETILLKAKLKATENTLESFKDAKELFRMAINMDKSERKFFIVTRFYKRYLNFFIKNNNSFEVSFDLLHEIIELIVERLKFVTTNHIRYEIELGNFYKRVIELLYQQLKMESESTHLIFEIDRYEKQFEIIINFSIEQLLLNLPQASETSYTNYLANEDDVNQFINAISLLFDYYNNRKRRLVNSENYQSDQIKKDYEKIYTLINQALYYDSSHSILLTNYFRIKVLLSNSQISKDIQNIDFSKFYINQKLFLIQFFLDHDLIELAKELCLRFGQLNSKEIKFKNDLVSCYVKLQLWDFATTIMIQINSIDKQLAYNYRVLAFILPINSGEHAKINIRLCERYNACFVNSKYEQDLTKRICKILFVSGNIQDSYTFFTRNLKSFQEKTKRKFPIKTSFDFYAKFWYQEFAEFSYQKILSIQSKELNDKTVLDVFNSITNLLNNLSLVNYNLIQNNFFDPHGFLKKVNFIKEKSLEILFQIINLQTDITSTVIFYVNEFFSKRTFSN